MFSQTYVPNYVRHPEWYKVDFSALIVEVPYGIGFMTPVQGAEEWKVEFKYSPEKNFILRHSATPDPFCPWQVERNGTINHYEYLIEALGNT